MVDDLPTVWQAEPHTRAKHAILERYLQAWFPILSRYTRRTQRGSSEILFIDGFAGPGEYAKGEPGSPVIALRAVLEHSVRFPVPVRLVFIERRADRYEHLRRVLEPYSQRIQQSESIRLSQPRQGECDAVLAAMLNEYEQQGIRFEPALAFLDQFGYSAVSMELMARILAYPQCEVFSYLDYKDMNRWISDPSKASGFTRTYGGEEWREAIPMPEPLRRTFLLEKYKEALRDRANVKYIDAFSMFDGSRRLLYWLIFCTNNLRGLEEMKKAMWKVDDTGGFHFSDKDNPDQLTLLSKEFDQPWLADELADQLAGREITAAAVKEYVLTSTPCHLFKKALRILETAAEPRLRVVRAPTTRRCGQFPNDHLDAIVIQFRERGFF